MSDDVTAPHASPALARGLAARLRDAVQASDRLASFVFDGGSGSARPASELADGEELATAHDFVLRVFHGASDPLNSRLLSEAVAAREGAPLDRLAGTLGLSRMATLERVNDLIQLGLVARDLQAGSVRATSAGEAIAELLAEIEIEVAEWLRRRKRG